MSAPALAELLPHAGPMRLLAAVLRHDERETECSLRVAASTLFAEADGAVPAWVALEWMAQAVAVHGGLGARAAGRAPAGGFLVGAKRVALRRSRFAPDETLRVSARWLGAAGALGSFACEVRDAEDRVAAEGTLSVYVSEDLAGARA